MSEQSNELRQAAQRVRAFLETKGWIQGQVHIPERGYCLLGAMDEVCRQDPDLNRSFYIALCTKVGLPSCWNDMPERTVEEVYELLDSIGA